MNRRPAAATPTVTVLFSAAGRRNQLMDCFRDAARALGVRIRVLAADMRPALSPACHSADAAFEVPHCLHADFHPRIQSLCRDHGVNLLIPTIDTELSGYARHAADYRRHGVHLNLSAPAVVELARDKKRFQEFLAASALPAPRTGETVPLAAASPAALAAALPFPCIFKPRDGSRSIGIRRARTPADLPPAALLRDPNYIWQELWEGREFTIHFYVDAAGTPAPAIVPCERLEVRDGEVSKGITRHIPALENDTRRLAAALAARGAYGVHCVQAILRPDGQHVFFELNARFGGGYPLAHHAGAPFARNLLQAALNLADAPAVGDDARPAAAATTIADFAAAAPVSPPPWQPDLLMLRYDTAHFLPVPPPSSAVP